MKGHWVSKLFQFDSLEKKGRKKKFLTIPLNQHRHHSRMQQVNTDCQTQLWSPKLAHLAAEDGAT